MAQKQKSIIIGVVIQWLGFGVCVQIWAFSSVWEHIGNICNYLYIYLYLGVDRIKTFVIMDPTPTKQDSVY